MAAADDPLDELTHEEKQELVEIVKARNDNSISRRDALRAAGLIGSGALLGGGASAAALEATGQASAGTAESGTLGTDADPLDLEGEDISASTIDNDGSPVAVEDHLDLQSAQEIQNAASVTTKEAEITEPAVRVYQNGEFFHHVLLSNHNNELFTAINAAAAAVGVDGAKYVVPSGFFAAGEPLEVGQDQGHINAKTMFSVEGQGRSLNAPNDRPLGTVVDVSGLAAGTPAIRDGGAAGTINQNIYLTDFLVAGSGGEEGLDQANGDLWSDFGVRVNFVNLDVGIRTDDWFIGQFDTRISTISSQAWIHTGPWQTVHGRLWTDGVTNAQGTPAVEFNNIKGSEILVGGQDIDNQFLSVTNASHGVRMGGYTEAINTAENAGEFTVKLAGYSGAFGPFHGRNQAGPVYEFGVSGGIGSGSPAMLGCLADPNRGAVSTGLSADYVGGTATPITWVGGQLEDDVDLSGSGHVTYLGTNLPSTTTNLGDDFSRFGDVSRPVFGSGFNLPDDVTATFGTDNDYSFRYDSANDEMIFLSPESGTIASLDNAGNMVLAGSLTENGSP